MRKLVLFTGLAILVSSCANNDSSVNQPYNNDYSGFRKFNIQQSKPAFKVLLAGAQMSTPDYETVWSVIETANDQGLIDSISQYAILYEGGIAHCIEISDPVVREEFLQILQQTPTSIEESFYEIVSVDDCSS